MRSHRRGTWIDTRRELAQLAWAVFLIDLVAIGLGALFSRSVGTFAIRLGVGVAIFVTFCFGLIVAGNLAVEQVAHWWQSRGKP